MNENSRIYQQRIRTIEEFKYKGVIMLSGCTTRPSAKKRVILGVIKLAKILKLM